MGAHFAFMQPVIDLGVTTAGRFVNLTDSGRCERAVILATGAGTDASGYPSSRH